MIQLSNRIFNLSVIWELTYIKFLLQARPMATGEALGEDWPTVMCELDEEAATMRDSGKPAKN